MKSNWPSFILFSIVLFNCNGTPEKVSNTTIDSTVVVLDSVMDSNPNLIETEPRDSDFLYRFCNEDHECGYVDYLDDTVIPIGAYQVVRTDTFKNFAIVMNQEYDWIGIDKAENELFEIFVFEQGPDYVKDGLFRIVADDKIGYANELGEIVIPPIYSCAWPFENGVAEVAFNCIQVQSDPEHWSWNSDEWFYIDKSGKRLPGIAE
ncbi:MAG: hypothetical protein GQ574_10065 [Crocinitomix sp.]|nr:hypothetical protein [Crocinitomix sp.]